MDPDQDLSQRLDLPDPLSSKEPINDHFNKYSELKLTTEQLAQYREAYTKELK